MKLPYALLLFSFLSSKFPVLTISKQIKQNLKTPHLSKMAKNGTAGDETCEIRGEEGKLTPQDILRFGETDSKFESPIDLQMSIFTEAYLPSLQWSNASENPKLMKVTNSGESVILSAKWFGPRPYLSNGPFMGYYTFSQVHFHWGDRDCVGSEHTINGISLPLEVHVMFFKSSYISQEEAMKRLDGITVIAYLCKLQDKDNLNLKPIIDALENIKSPYTSQHIDLIPLSSFFPLFTDDYFLYWGNVVNSHRILWLICRQPLPVSSNQLSRFRKVTDSKNAPMLNNYRQIKSLNYRKVLLVNPNNNMINVLHDFPEEIHNEKKSFYAEKSKKHKPNNIHKAINIENNRLAEIHYLKEEIVENNETEKYIGDSSFNEIVFESTNCDKVKNDCDEIDHKVKMLQELINSDKQKELSSMHLVYPSKDDKKNHIISKIEEFLRGKDTADMQTKEDNYSTENSFRDQLGDKIRKETVTDINHNESHEIKKMKMKHGTTNNPNEENEIKMPQSHDILGAPVQKTSHDCPESIKERPKTVTLAKENKMCKQVKDTKSLERLKTVQGVQMNKWKTSMVREIFQNSQSLSKNENHQEKKLDYLQFKPNKVKSKKPVWKY